MRSRGANYILSDENLVEMNQKNLFSETAFTSVDQTVEKSEIDFFGVFKNSNQIISDIVFIGALREFNVPLIKDSWFSSTKDFL